MYVMTLPPPIFNDFFRNPFGGEMKPIGGMGGEGGVLENIQQQVSENGQALQALQGGIGGLPNTPFTPFRPPTRHPIENPGELLNLLDFQPPIAPVQDELRLEPTSFEPLLFSDAAADSAAQLRADYDKAVADAKRQRAEGMLGRVVLPGEMSFEDFAKSQLKPGSPFDMLGGPMQSDIFNIAQVEPNPGMDYSNLTMTTGNLYNDINTGSPQTLSDIQPIYERPEPNIGMDQLFGRAFAGKPV